jgi:hypothetical protein
MILSQSRETGQHAQELPSFKVFKSGHASLFICLPKFLSSSTSSYILPSYCVTSSITCCSDLDLHIQNHICSKTCPHHFNLSLNSNYFTLLFSNVLFRLDDRHIPDIHPKQKEKTFRKGTHCSQKRKPDVHIDALI